MSPTELTAIGGFVLSLVALVILPLWFRRQTRKQTEAAEKRAAEKEQEEEDRRLIREKAEREAKAAEIDVVSWEKINQRLTITVEKEQLAHERRLTELREGFADEVQRIKRQYDYDLDRAKQEISRLADRVEDLTRQVLAQGAKSER